MEESQLQPDRSKESEFLLSDRKSFYSSIHGIEDSGYQSPKDGAEKSHRTLTTFGGVFAPVALSQFSTLLFLRIGFIIGSVGLCGGFGTLTLAYGILLTTVLSISAISTNGAIEGGGVYYMISRILGPEFGGAVGVLFVCANVMGSGLYNIGCIEGILESFGLEADDLALYKFLPSGKWPRLGYRSLLNAFNLLICCIGAGMFSKTVVFLFFIILTCTVSLIVSFVTVSDYIEIIVPESNSLHFNQSANYTGISVSTLTNNLYPQQTTDYTTLKYVDFPTVFSVIFSGLTGIMNGANMSGELKNPGFSIPVGTLSALGFTFSVYSLLFVLTAATCSRFLLQNDYNFLMGINVWAPFVTIGVTTATLSASLSKMIGASRVLAAIVKDSLFGRMLHWVGLVKVGSNPIGSVLLVVIFIQGILFIGELNTIAKITSIFFLMSHCATSMACFCLEWASAPNFRPTFRYFSWWTALAGILANGFMMFLISPMYSTVCIMLCLILVIVLHLRTPLFDQNWGSISQAILYHQVRKFLLLLDSRKDHVLFWRPQILLLVNDPRFNCPLLDFMNDLKKSGLYILGHVVVSHGTAENNSDPAVLSYPKWQYLVDHLKIKAFIEVTVAQSVREGVRHLARLAGLGAMKPNTVVLGFCDDSCSQNFFQSECSPFYVASASKKGKYVPETRGTRKRRETSHSLNHWQDDYSYTRKLSPSEFVGIIRDLLVMKKNICICRHFQMLDKELILRRTNVDKYFIDVWPTNFFDFSVLDKDNKSLLFCLQMAAVLNMVPAWHRRTELRIFLCVYSYQQEDLEREKAVVLKLLRDLRIEAVIVILSLSTSSLMRRWTSNENVLEGSCSMKIPLYSLPETFTKEINLLIRENSTRTALSFISLPPPPEESLCDTQYLNALKTVTQRLPPTVLVHGLSSVTDFNSRQ